MCKLVMLWSAEVWCCLFVDREEEVGLGGCLQCLDRGRHQELVGKNGQLQSTKSRSAFSVHVLSDILGRRTRTPRPGFGLERSDVDSHPNILAIKASTNLRVGGASCFFLSPCLLPLVSLSTFIPQTKTPTPRRSVTMAIKFTICRGFPSTPNHVWSPFVNNPRVETRFRRASITSPTTPLLLLPWHGSVLGGRGADAEARGVEGLAAMLSESRVATAVAAVAVREDGSDDAPFSILGRADGRRHSCGFLAASLACIAYVFPLHAVSLRVPVLSLVCLSRLFLLLALLRPCLFNKLTAVASILPDQRPTNTKDSKELPSSCGLRKAKPRGLLHGV